MQFFFLFNQSTILFVIRQANRFRAISTCCNLEVTGVFLHFPFYMPGEKSKKPVQAVLQLNDLPKSSLSVCVLCTRCSAVTPAPYSIFDVSLIPLYFMSLSPSTVSVHLRLLCFSLYFSIGFYSNLIPCSV